MFEHKTLQKFIIGNSIFISDKSNKLDYGSLLKGNVYYNFNLGNYKTVNKTLEEKICKICVLIISKNKLAVGLEYCFDWYDGPVLALKTYGDKWITKVCKKNKIYIIYNKKLAEKIFFNNEENSVISTEIWEEIARTFVSIKDKTFWEKIKYKEKDVQCLG